MAAGARGLDTIAVSIHGPAGVLDLVVPPGASAADLAREYAEQSELGSIPLVYSRTGQPLRPDLALDDAGVETGDVLVAMTSVHRPPRSRREERRLRAQQPPGPLSATWFWVAGALALLAGWFGSQSDDPVLGRRARLGCCCSRPLVGVLPVGRFARRRVLVAPAFAAAAAYAVLADPDPARLPLVIGMSAIAASVCAAVGRALSDEPDEGLTVWMVVGSALFVTAGLAALLGFSAAVVWSVALAVAVLAARFVPMYAVDVPDSYLIDLDRLAVTAWSARERRPGRRGRIVVPPGVVSDVASSAARTMTAASAAIAAVVVLASTLLLTRVDARFDLIGVRCLVFFAGASLLLTARSHRHVGPRVLLRVAGLSCWAVLAAHGLALLSEPRRAALLGVLVALGIADGAGRGRDRARLALDLVVEAGRGGRGILRRRRAREPGRLHRTFQNPVGSRAVMFRVIDVG